MTESQVLEIMKKELGLDDLKLEVAGQWDSLDYIQVLMALDVAMNEKLKDIKELETCITPKQVIDLLKKHGLLDG